MNKDRAVLIVEDSDHESTLVTSAIALADPALEVRTVADLQAANIYLTDGASTAKHWLIILGSRALRELKQAIKVHGNADVVVVGVGDEVQPSTRQRALQMGVLAVEDRPSTWKEYRALVDSIIRARLPKPDGAPGMPLRS